MPTKAKEREFEMLYCKARMAGLEAANACTPTPMVVQEHTNPLNDNSPVKQEWVVPSGVCGFAWVIIRPGNGSFANWMRKNDHARTDSYYGGANHYVSEFGQSMERKEAYAHAFAKVLTSAGIKAYSHSRMD